MCIRITQQYQLIQVIVTRAEGARKKLGPCTILMPWWHCKKSLSACLNLKIFRAPSGIGAPISQILDQDIQYDSIEKLPPCFRMSRNKGGVFQSSQMTSKIGQFFKAKIKVCSAFLAKKSRLRREKIVFYVLRHDFTLLKIAQIHTNMHVSTNGIE